MTAPWEQFVQSNFPGYLLPESASRALSVDEAVTFLQRLTGRPHQLALLRAASTLSPRMVELRAFAFQLLPAFVRSMPSHTEIVRREWEGGFQGRLDVRATLSHWTTGQRTRFVTRSPKRSFVLLENILVKGVAERLLRVLVDLRQAKAVGASGWGSGAQACEGQLRHLLSSTVLRDVPLERINSHHEAAAHAGRGPCYSAALGWHRVLRQGLDSLDPSQIAAVVANGALSPLDDATRFEIAVVIRLMQAIWGRIESTAKGRWTYQRCLVRSDRREVGAFERDDGAEVRIYYNQSYLEAGPTDLGAKHYLESRGRMRPDVTIVARNGSTECATVIEVKLTESADYMLQGFHEAMLYRWEYAHHLRGWPKALLVGSKKVPGAIRSGDDVIAIGWSAWVPEPVVDGILDAIK